MPDDLTDARCSTLEIRPLRGTADEIAEVSALAVTAYAGDYELPADYLSEIGDVAGRAQGADLWVAELDGVVVGTVTVPRPGERLHDDTLPGEMDVRLLAVAVSARGRGVAVALMQHCLQLARERGARRVVLHTASNMSGAIRLYERLGFVEIPERGYPFEECGELRRLIAYGIEVGGRAA